MTPHLPGGFQFLNGDGFGVYEHVRLYVSGDQFVEAGSPMNHPRPKADVGGYFTPDASWVR